MELNGTFVTDARYLNAEERDEGLISYDMEASLGNGVPRRPGLPYFSSTVDAGCCITSSLGV